MSCTIVAPWALAVLAGLIAIAAVLAILIVRQEWMLRRPK